MTLNDENVELAKLQNEIIKYVGLNADNIIRRGCAGQRPAPGRRSSGRG